MSKMTVKKVCLVSEVIEVKPRFTAGGGKKKKAEAAAVEEESIYGCKCRMPKSSGFLKKIGKKVAKAIKLMSNGKKSSRKVSSTTLSRSRSYAENCSLDSQRAEAINDCIEFLHSSSSLPRSNSLKSSC